MALIGPRGRTVSARQVSHIQAYRQYLRGGALHPESTVAKFATTGATARTYQQEGAGDARLRPVV